MTLGHAVRLTTVASASAGLLATLVLAGVAAALLLSLIAPALGAPELAPTRWEGHLSVT